MATKHDVRFDSSRMSGGKQKDKQDPLRGVCLVYKVGSSIEFFTKTLCQGTKTLRERENPFC